MGKETLIRIKKSLAILLVVLFLATVTSMTVSATFDRFDPAWNQQRINAYNAGHNSQVVNGQNAGFFYGVQDGRRDCRNGQPAAGNSRIHYKFAPPGAAARTLGQVDGYNDGIEIFYDFGYVSGYFPCPA